MSQKIIKDTKYCQILNQWKLADEGKIMEGRVMFLELAKDEEEDDMLYLLLDNEKQFSIGISI